MLALIIIVALLVLFLILPVGVDAAYQAEVFSLKVKAGPVRIRILPKKQKRTAESQGEKPKKKKKKPKAGAAHDSTGKPKPGLADFLEIAKVILKILSNFRRCLSLDVFYLTYVCAAPDPYDAIMQYGYFNAGFSVLAPLLHRILNIRDERILLDVDVMSSKAVIDARIVATLQIWELFYIGFCAGFGFLRWFLPFKKAARAKEKEAKKKNAAGAVPVEQKG